MNPIKIIKFDDFLDSDIPEVPSILGENLIVPQGRVIIYGQPGSYKSFATVQLCRAMANGVDWLGYEMKVSATTLYLQGEIVAKMMQGRGLSARAEYGHADNTFYSYARDLTLNSEAHWKALTERIVENKIEFIFLDPLSQLLGGSEVDDSHVRAWLDRMDVLCTEANAGVVMVHHGRKTTWRGDGSSYSGAQNLRGWSGLEGWADSIIHLSSPKRAQARLEWQKVRHNEKPEDRWLHFSQKNGILQVSDEDPATIVRRLLSVGPRMKGDIDKALLEEAGIKYNKANELRKTLVAKGEIAYDLMEDNKTRMYRMVE
jgi:RecA-family ATPase